ncbi:MAG: HNH endonuclease [Candidatus Eremiobacter antarcticus]|nr:HNH endonuclease [Candidatus Eremiobacteraeota bacterium]MBC5807454.1 HNH endonuclease [Candidatus Eremiobacteraeota bacterium]PZR61484.1 MAG: HNH endonuclease [Candidatus Eremiobacter sp. RRmetagenome_bin22]
MRYWWVNQNQTHRQEIGGGYLWSPKRNASGARNPYYEFMREIAPGDLVFSFVETRIIAIGTVTTYCYESPKPTEFGATGLNWEAIGWRVHVSFTPLSNRIRPREHMDLLRRLIPPRYSPLQTSGAGIQSVYLTELSEPFANTLIGLIGPEASLIAGRVREVDPRAAIQTLPTELELWERHIEAGIESDSLIPETQREALITARRGQGLFKQRVSKIESHCRITRVSNTAHLRASHCKPWRDSNNEERLNGENGLLLTPTIDHLFDRGFIGFEDTGELIISPVADQHSLNRMGVATDHTINVGPFSNGQKHFLEFHRNSVLLRAVR